MARKRHRKRQRTAKEKLEGFRARDPLAASLKRPDSPYRSKKVPNKKKNLPPITED